MGYIEATERHSTAEDMDENRIRTNRSLTCSARIGRLQHLRSPMRDARRDGETVLPKAGMLRHLNHPEGLALPPWLAYPFSSSARALPPADCSRAALCCQCTVHSCCQCTPPLPSPHLGPATRRRLRQPQIWIPPALVRASPAFPSPLPSPLMACPPSAGRCWILPALREPAAVCAHNYPRPPSSVNTAPRSLSPHTTLSSWPGRRRSTDLLILVPEAYGTFHPQAQNLRLSCLAHPDTPVDSRRLRIWILTPSGVA